MKVKIRSLKQLEKYPLVKLILEEEIRFLSEASETEDPNPVLASFFEFEGIVEVKTLAQTPDETLYSIFASAFPGDEGGPVEFVAKFERFISPTEMTLEWIARSFDGLTDFIFQDRQKRTIAQIRASSTHQGTIHEDPEPDQQIQ